jgi:hypothetical protein
MATLRIYDLREGRVLALDLRDLVDLFAPRSLEASWTVSPVSVGHSTPTVNQFEAVPRGDDDHLKALAVSGAPVSGAILSQYAHETRQVIWGQFVGALPEQMDAWITIRAIDSTFYEVTTSDEVILAKIRSTYKNVRDPSDPAFSAPFSHTAAPYVAPDITGTFGATLFKVSLKPA